MLIFEPISPWSEIAATLLAAATMALLVRGILDRLRGRPLWETLAGTPKTRIATLLCSILAASLLAAAAMNPRWTDKPGEGAFHLQLAVDVSASVLRARGGWERIRRLAHERITTAINAMPGNLKNQCSAGIITFRDFTDETTPEIPLDQLPGRFLQVDEGTFAGGSGTDIEKGLEHAALALQKAGGRGAVLLISDGNEVSGDGLVAARDLARRGVPVHVYPVTSQGPAIAITDADLPRQTHSNTKTFVRGMMLNRQDKDEQAKLTLAKENNSTGKTVSLPSGQWVRFRWPVVFDGFGLQYVDMALAAKENGGLQREPHRRRFFTYVKRPPRILVVGGDSSWIAAIPGDTAEMIPVSSKETLTPQRLRDIDAVVINGVPARALGVGSMEVLARAVKDLGKGLMLINGGHWRTSDEAETVVMSYKDTPLDDLLPVTGGPRPFTDKPPQRHVAILIDTSGSMATPMRGGSKRVTRLEKARQIARYIVKELLRPEDRLDLITFTTGAGHLIKDRPMDEAGKEAAIRHIDRIRFGGGTDPNRALALLGSRKMTQCGLIFISDGEFGYVGYRPDCRATVFEIGGNRAIRSQAIKQLADPVAVGPDFDPAAISIPFFEPEERLKFFERETFRPLSMAQHLPRQQRLPVPYLDLRGSAVCYLKEDAVLNGVRPKLVDPVLAFCQRGAGYTMFFGSDIPLDWVADREGREAIEAWVAHLVPFMERDRYDFKVRDHGDSMDLRIALVTTSGKIPDVNSMSATLEFPDNSAVPVAMRADDVAPGTFHGRIEVKRTNRARHGVLAVRESGPDGLARIQRVPIVIPPRGTVNPPPTAEADSHGQNRKLLKQIADCGGGLFNPPKGTPFFKEHPTPGKGFPLWPIASTVAAIFYLIAIIIKKWTRD